MLARMQQVNGELHQGRRPVRRRIVNSCATRFAHRQAAKPSIGGVSFFSSRLDQRLRRADLGNRVQVRLAFGQLHEEFLGVEGRCILEDFAGAKVAAVGLLQARLDCVGKISGQNLVVDAGQDLRVANRKGRLERNAAAAGSTAGLHEQQRAGAGPSPENQGSRRAGFDRARIPIRNRSRSACIRSSGRDLAG